MKSNDIRNRLRHALIPALPVPFTTERTIHRESHIRMAEYMADLQLAGIAVWAHTGRGMLMTSPERAEVLTHWRESLPNAVIIAGAGSHAMADQARSLGADAILCHPPTHLRNRPERERTSAIISYHEELSNSGLPLILFYLYDAAGGISYSPEILDRLFAVPNVIGMKIATLDSVMTFQDVARHMKTEYPEMLLITGEDRFLGYSLMMGADASLIGMGSALTAPQVDLLKAWYAEDMVSFFYYSDLIDRFSMVTFSQPMEGYIARMLYALSWLGIVSPEATYDPWGRELSREEIQRIADFLNALPADMKRR